MDHLFLSDAHIGAFSEETDRKIENDLIELIDFAIHHRMRVAVLGDLFDYWMEYPDRKPDLGSSLLKKFEEYNRTVGAAIYVTGNHDNWTFGYFSKIGFRVEPEGATISLGDQSCFLHHGDGLKNPDAGLPRPLMHKILRNRWFVKLYQTVFPAEVGIDLMKTFSAISRDNSEISPERLSRWSRSFLQAKEIELVISGHDHIPRVETFPFGTYINLGTFYSHRTVGLYTNSQLKLVTWSAAEQQFKPYNPSALGADRHSS
ncbi:MAG: metallophosphoesterase [Balneolaceae bacterium]|nr:metallophosphoesterase [Balneolaceae bacterium]MCH8547545.1 metallophosphoesterase family protein [Balneolaceae bacterium]